MFRYFMHVWRQTGQRTRRVLIAAWIVGTILQGVGIAGDLLDVTDNFPFAVNSLSNFTWACFAVPFAILVLQEYTRHQELQKQQRKLLEDAKSAVSSLSMCGQKLQASLLSCDVKMRKHLEAQTREAIALMESYKGEPLEGWVRTNGPRLLGHMHIVIHGWNYSLGMHSAIKPSLQEFSTIGVHLRDRIQVRLYEDFSIVWPLMDNLNRFQEATQRLLDQLCRGKQPSNDGGRNSLLAQNLSDSHITLGDALNRITIDPSFIAGVLKDIYGYLRQSEKDYQVREDLHDAIGHLVGQCEDLADKLPLHPSTSAAAQPLNK